MGRVLMAADDDWSAVLGNLRKVRKSWERLASIMRWEGANPRLSGMFFKAVLQAVMIFRS